MTDKEKFYITTSIPYLNGSPHLGFALEAVQADAIARYERSSGKDVFFLSGTDEHGVKVARAAEAESKDPREFVDEKSALFSELLKKLSITNDLFIRTTDKELHWPGVEALWKKMAESGDIYKGFYSGFYCVGHEAFITSKDIADGVCALHKKAPEKIEEENYFFKLAKYAPEIKKLIQSGGVKILPEWRIPEIINMLEDIPDISFSRPSKDLAWGIPVPGDNSQTIYVWADALPNYITGLGYGRGGVNYQKYWPADMHVIGKDIVKFHAVFWLGMLLSVGLPLPKNIFIHGFINVKGEKMSKSIGNVIDPFPLIEKFGADAVRFYLLNEISTFSDGDYNDGHFNDVYNGNLVHGVGNLLSRVLKMMSSYTEIPKPKEEDLTRFPFRKDLDFLSVSRKAVSIEEVSPSFLADNILWPYYRSEMDKFELASASQAVWAFLRKLDEYIEDYKPYKLLKTEEESAKIILWHLAYSLVSAAWMIKPFLPETSDKILHALGVSAESQEPWAKFTAKETMHLFPKI
ncbi:methionine--tRNA ligase [Candidatus Giovannonibacteria bacterium]|nr:methionine--tRNA ligase [Candidatus Giovannonibacteria bacterium]